MCRDDLSFIFSLKVSLVYAFVIFIYFSLLPARLVDLITGSVFITFGPYSLSRNQWIFIFLIWHALLWFWSSFNAFPYPIIIFYVSHLDPMLLFDYLLSYRVGNYTKEYQSYINVSRIWSYQTCDWVWYIILHNFPYTMGYTIPQLIPTIVLVPKSYFTVKCGLMELAELWEHT